MLFFSMKNKAIVNVNTGEKIGYLSVCDLKIDEATGRIQALLLPKSRFSALFGRDEEDYTEIPWAKIKKIGVDTILVEV